MENDKHNSRYRILVVDDEIEVLELIVSALEFADFEVVGVKNATTGIDLVLNQEFDAGVFDVMLPDFGGFTLVERIRTKGFQLPVLFLTAKDSISNKLQGFAVGGDDYLVKPFAVEELIARVNAIIRRSQTQQLEVTQDNYQPDGLSVANLVINTQAHEVFQNGQLVELSPTEFSLLKLLVECKGRVVTKQEIMEYIWGQNFTEDYSIIDTYISFIRKKLNDGFEGNRNLIETKRGIGYIVKDRQ